MKRLDWVLGLALGTAVAAACSATGAGRPGASGGPDASATGGGGGSHAGASGGGQAGLASAGTSGAAPGSGGTPGSGGGLGGWGGAAGGAGSGGIDDGGVTDANEDALIGDGGTTIVIGTGADASTPGKFSGPIDPGASPTVVYPETGVLIPPNMNSLEFHFIPAPGQTLFQFSFHAPTQNLEVYVGCTPLGAGCVFTPDQTFWKELVAYARGTAPVSWTLRGVDGAGKVGASAEQTMIFSKNDIIGGIYYWNTRGVIQRYDFGNPGKAAEQYLTPASGGAAICVGCHALSRDGRYIAIGKDIPSPAPYTVFNVANKTVHSAGGKPFNGQSNFFSFSPDSAYLLFSGGINVQQRDLATGALASGMVAKPGTMPDWSPDGTLLVYAKPKTAPFAPQPGVSSASLELLSYGGGSSWTNPKTLVPFTGQNSYYPAFSPDSQWVVFNRSPGNHESYSNSRPDSDAGTVPDGELWAVSRSGGALIQLAHATRSKWSSWPKWAPNVQTYYDGTVMWLTFSSSRAYGLRLADGAKTQLWMVGFDPAKAAAGKDPSFAAFWLPFQDITGGNHIAQWVTRVLRQPCKAAADCPGTDFCRGGYCFGI